LESTILISKRLLGEKHLKDLFKYVDYLTIKKYSFNLTEYGLNGLSIFDLEDSGELNLLEDFLKNRDIENVYLTVSFDIIFRKSIESKFIISSKNKNKIKQIIEDYQLLDKIIQEQIEKFPDIFDSTIDTKVSTFYYSYKIIDLNNIVMNAYKNINK
jgi:hypothetical protein